MRVKESLRGIATEIQRLVPTVCQNVTVFVIPFFAHLPAWVYRSVSDTVRHHSGAGRANVARTFSVPEDPTMPRRPSSRLAALFASGLSALLLAACSSPPRLEYRVPDQPEGSSGYTEKPGWASERFAVAAANPLATDAGH